MRAVTWIAAAVSVVVLVATGVAWTLYRSATGNITHLDAVPTAGTHNKAGDVDGTDQNILLVGDDSRAGMTATQLKELATQNDGGGVNTDTMMMLHIPADGSRATVVSLPRDLWIQVPGYGYNKLNAAFVLGSHGRTDAASRTAGFRLLIQTLDSVTGLHIDHFVEVNLWGFYTISKAIGGVPIDLCAPVHDPYSGVDLSAGKQTIEGTQALAFVRQRHGLPGGDLDRVRRQQYFIGQVFRKMSSAGVLLNPIKLNRLLDATTKALTTDPTLNPIKLATQMRGLTAGNLRFTTVPITGEPRINGLDVITYDPAAVKKFFATLTHPAPASSPHPTPASTVPTSQVTVNVYNANGQPGLAGHTATALAGKGFQASVGGNLAPQTATEIRYPPAKAAAARTLAKAVPGARLVRTTGNGAVLQLVLGTADPTENATPTSVSTPTPTPTTRSAADPGCIN